jgi:hypothetical protein
MNIATARKTTAERMLASEAPLAAGAVSSGARGLTGEHDGNHRRVDHPHRQFPYLGPTILRKS